MLDAYAFYFEAGMPIILALIAVFVMAKIFKFL